LQSFPHLSLEAFFSSTDIGDKPGNLMLTVKEIDSSLGGLGIEADGEASGLAVELSAGVLCDESVDEPAPKRPLILSTIRISGSDD
jgi:hypothetical protein